MTDAYDQFFDTVYSQEPTFAAEGRIQWKGTSVCMDITCSCGEYVHADAECFYYFQCRRCGQGYAVGQTVKLIPLTTGQSEYVRKEALELQSFGRIELSGPAKTVKTRLAFFFDSRSLVPIDEIKARNPDMEWIEAIIHNPDTQTESVVLIPKRKKTGVS